MINSTDFWLFNKLLAAGTAPWLFSAHWRWAWPGVGKNHKLTEPRTVQRGKADVADKAFLRRSAGTCDCLQRSPRADDTGLDFFAYFLDQAKKYVVGSWARNMLVAFAKEGAL